MPAQFARTTRSLAKDSAAGAILVWGIAALALAAWCGWMFFGRVAVYEVSTKARLEVREAAHPVSAWLPSRIVSSALVVGRMVQAGDVLVELDASSETLRLGEEESRRAGFTVQIAALEKEIAARERAIEGDRIAAGGEREAAEHRIREAEAGLQFASDQERRLQSESELGSVAKVEALQASVQSSKLAAARAALGSELKRMQAQAETRVHEQRAQVESLRRTLAGLRGESDTAVATMARLRADIDKLRLRAPVAGRIGDVLPLHVGDMVAAGQRLATIVPAGDFIVVADFEPAAVLGHVREGQPARLRLDGFPWAQHGSMAATVSRVASETHDQLVRVELVPRPGDAPTIAAQHGLPGVVEIQVDELSPALLVLRASGQLLNAPRGAAALR